MQVSFSTFIAPVLKKIDTGVFFITPFKWLYIILAGLNIFFPFLILVKTIQGGIFNASFKYGVVFFITWILIVFTSWIGFQIWWNRKDYVLNKTSGNDEFIVTPVFSHFIQTFGEWVGSYIIIAGTGSSLITTIFLGRQNELLNNLFPILDIGFLSVLIIPLIGFLIIVFFRFVSEQFKALSSLVNNTKTS